MKFRLPIAIVLLALTAAISCKKSDGPTTAEFQAITFKFGPDATSITIDQATQILKNLPRSCDPTQLVATAILPSGFTISPDPSTSKNYTTGVTYTITNAQGNTYTMQISAPAYHAANNPYGIYTPKHLSDIRNGLNDSYVLMNDIELPNLNATDAATSTGISDYATYGWYSIGTSYVNGGHVIFRGSLDGQNHVIKNLSSSYRGTNLPAGIDAGHNGKSYEGLFGYAIHANFKNIGIQLATSGIIGVATDGNSYGPLGSLVGRVDSSTITNCNVTGNSLIVGGQYTGGLIGRALSSTVSKCYSALSPATGNYAIIAGGDGGGLIGGVVFSGISDSYSSSSIQGVTSVGGLTGSINTSVVATSFASGNVSEIPSNTVVALTPSNNLGGLIGSVSTIPGAQSNIDNCFATGAVAGANGSNTNLHLNSRIGGLIGQITSTSGPVAVRFSYATGAVSRFHTSATAPYLIGGLVGTTGNNVFVVSSNSTNYWDKEKTGQSALGGGNGALATDNAFTTNGKTTAEMKTASTFVNWDFSAVWTVTAGKNNGYPSLRSITQ